MARLGVSALITGNVGPNALQTLTAANIEVYQHQGGTVRDVVDQFKRGELTKITSPSVPVQAGMGQGRGRGGGFGGRARVRVPEEVVVWEGRGSGVGGAEEVEDNEGLYSHHG